MSQTVQGTGPGAAGGGRTHAADQSPMPKSLAKLGWKLRRNVDGSWFAANERLGHKTLSSDKPGQAAVYAENMQRQIDEGQITPAGQLPDDLLAAGWTLREYKNGKFRAEQKAYGNATLTEGDLSEVIGQARHAQKLRAARDTETAPTPETKLQGPQTSAEAGPAEDDEAATPVFETAPLRARFTRSLDCTLTERERLIRADELTYKLGRKASLEGELRDVSAGYKGRIKTVELGVRKLSQTLSSRLEAREVECEEHFNYDAKQVEVVRLDTSEIVESRPMKASELQRRLPVV